MPKQIHIGIVTNNQTGPDGLLFNRGEVMIKSETLLSDGSEYPIPATPCFPLADPLGFGMFWVPNIGATVELEVEDGPDYLVESEIRYRCALYSDMNFVPDELLENYPFRKGFKFMSGLFMFDDMPGQFLIQLFHTMGHGFELTREGDVNWMAMRDQYTETLRDHITFARRDFILEADRDGKIDFDGEFIMDVMGDYSLKVSSELLMEVTGLLKMTSDTKIVIDAPQIELVDGATEPMVMGDVLKSFFIQIKAMIDGHIHPGVKAGGSSTGQSTTQYPDAPTELVSDIVYGA